MNKFKHFKNRLSLSVDKLSPSKNRSPSVERRSEVLGLSATLSAENLHLSNSPSPPLDFRRSPPPFLVQKELPSNPSGLQKPDLDPPGSPTPFLVQKELSINPSGFEKSFVCKSDSFPREKPSNRENSPEKETPMSDSEIESSKDLANESFDSFSGFPGPLSENEPQSLIDEVMKEVDKISKKAGDSSESKIKNSAENVIVSKSHEEIDTKRENKIDLTKTSSGNLGITKSIGDLGTTMSSGDLGITKSSDDTLNTGTSESSSASLSNDKSLFKQSKCSPNTDSTFTTISTASVLHAESLTSGYFSDSASEDALNSDLKERKIRAKTTSPIQRMFRLSRPDLTDNNSPSSGSPLADDAKKDVVKKESIYSRLIKSTKKDSSSTKTTKEPLYARIKPKLKAESSFKPIEPVVSKESSSSDLLVKPEPIYSKIKPKKPSSPTVVTGTHSPITSPLSISTGSPTSSFTPVTPPIDKEPSKEPLYSCVKPKKEKTRTLPLESLYSKIRRKDANTLPKENVTVTSPRKREPIYNQPLPALPLENQNNQKKYEFLSKSGPESVYGQVVAVTAKELSAVSPSKPSVITISNPGYAKTLSYVAKDSKPANISPINSPLKFERISSQKPPDKENLPQSPVEEIKSDSEMQESITSITSLQDGRDTPASNLAIEEEIKMDLGSSSKLTRLVEELAIELETVSQRNESGEVIESKRDVLNRLLSTYDVPKNLRRVEEADEDEIRRAERSLLRSSSEDGLRYMDDDENMETVYADVPDYSQDEFVIALDDENDPKYASLTRGMRNKPRGAESPGKVSRKSAQVYVNVLNVISALKVLINSNSTKAATVINKMGTLARPYAQKVHTSINDNNTWIQRKLFHRSGHNGFDELRKYIKSGGEFCKELAIIMHERAELEASYAKGLHKLSAKLVKASRDSIGSISEAWQSVGAELEHEGDVHRILAASLSEDVVRPLRQVIETQHKIRKGVEGMVDKATKNLHDWRTAEMKAKKNCYHNARENEKIQDMVLDSRLGRGRSFSEKEMVKLEKQRRKAEEAVQKSDVEYYSYCIRTERARQEWESAVYKGSNCFQTLEEERLASLKDLILKYHKTNKDAAPKLVGIASRLDEPVALCDVEKDIQTVITAKGTGEHVPQQYLPDFYSEDLNNVMNKARRREALEKFLKLIRIDIERERRGKQGVENLAKALQETPNFGGEDSQQDVNDKLQNMKAMLAYLEASRYKVQTTLNEINSRPKVAHPLAKHIEIQRDKQGLPVSILKVPPWIKGSSTDISPLSESPTTGSPNWNDRGTADGTSVQPDSDFDEFSSQGSDHPDYQTGIVDTGQQVRSQKVISQSLETRSVITEEPVNSSANRSVPGAPADGVYFARPMTTTGGSNLGRCKALYDYEANLYDELSIRAGDVINIHEKQPDGWWIGEIDGNVGIFPATYVEEME